MFCVGSHSNLHISPVFNNNNNNNNNKQMHLTARLMVPYWQTPTRQPLPLSPAPPRGASARAQRYASPVEERDALRPPGAPTELSDEPQNQYRYHHHVPWRTSRGMRPRAPCRPCCSRRRRRRPPSGMLFVGE